MQWLASLCIRQPVLTWVPNPGERPGIRDAWALTVRLIFLF